MRASRLLSILLMLQTRGRMSAPALAAVLEVSPRTILRDMDHLSASGVPVWSDRGREGGFQLREGWTTQLTGLTTAEAQALFLAGLPTAATELGLGGASASAQLKMLAALPAAVRDDAQRVSARLHIDAMDWFRAATPPLYLQAVAGAVWHQRVICMQYESWTDLKERTVQPLGLVLKAGVWYMVALLAGRSAQVQVKGKAKKQKVAKPEPRTFRLSNIHQLTVLADTFTRPENFELAAFWQTATKRFETNIYTDTAQLRVTARGLQAVCAISPTVAAAATGSKQKVEQAATQDNTQKTVWLQVQIPIESIHHATGQLWAMGPEVQVQSPAALRAQIQQRIHDMAALYA